MNYGIYKDVRDAAWNCLIDCKINRLPVNLKKITEQFNIKVIKNSSVNLLYPSENGASILYAKECFIVIDDENTIQRCRFTIAHELGHILLGHPTRNGYHARTIDKDRPEIEREADMFASRLLAPACVLWGLGLHTAEEIAKACNISLTAAAIRTERMEVLYKRGKFLTNPLERRVYSQFSNFIEQNRLKADK